MAPHRSTLAAPRSRRLLALALLPLLLAGCGDDQPAPSEEAATGEAARPAAATSAGPTAPRTAGPERKPTGEPKHELVDTSWQLVEIIEMDDTVHLPDDPASYTLSFDDDGRARIKADCRVATGSWQAGEPGQITFGMLAVPQTFCEPGPIHDVFLGQFQQVRSYVLADGHLYLATANDSAIIELEPSDGGG